MINWRLKSFCSVPLIVATVLFSTHQADAAKIKTTELNSAEVERSVADALADLTDEQISLLEIVGIFQPKQTDLSSEDVTAANSAIILASLSGSVTLTNGAVFTFNGGLEQIFCQQLENESWLCVFGSLSSVFSGGQAGVAHHFFLED